MKTHFIDSFSQDKNKEMNSKFLNIDEKFYSRITAMVNAATFKNI